MNFSHIQNDKKLIIGSVIGVGAIAAAASFYHFYKKKQLENTPPKKWRKVGEISELICYPIKSCGPVRIKQIHCNLLGLEDGHLRDRVFMVITPEGQFVTARAQPKLVLVQPKFEKDTMILSAPGMMDLTIDFNHLYTIPPTKTSVWQQSVQTIDCGEEAARWFSRFICQEDIGLRLVFYSQTFPTRPVRPKNVKYDTMTPVDAGALHDASSYMLLNESSLSDLNTKIDHIVTALQFRPNFVVKGAQPLEEDNWKWIRIGNDVVFKNVKPCTRCIFTNIDPETAKRQPDGEPLKVLKQYRSILPGESPVLGIHLGVRTHGQVLVGDSVYVEDESYDGWGKN